MAAPQQQNDSMSSAVDAVLERNHRYVRRFTGAGLPGRPPRLKLAVLTCLDCRLHTPAFPGLELGDAHILLRSAGGVGGGSPGAGTPAPPHHPSLRD